MLAYQSVPAVRRAFSESHERFWHRLAAPGTWWTGTERIAIAHEARTVNLCAYCADRKAALSPRAVRGRHTTVTDLPPAAIEVIHAVMTDASRLTRAWYASRLADGLSEGQYVEIVGAVTALVSIDRFCRGIGVEQHPLPGPIAGAPTRYRPASAGPDEAWVPMVPLDNAATPEADLWPAGRTGNVVRAMSLVPDEVRTLGDLSAAHYLPHTSVRDPSCVQGRLTRPQMELIEGRVSVLNDCFY